MRDAETGLVWQRVQSSGMIGWKAAKDACQALTLGGDTWRLPEVYELLTLLDVTTASPSGLDPSFFSAGEPGDYYWTATPDAVAPTQSAWLVDVSTGVASPGNNMQEFSVRCVR